MKKLIAFAVAISMFTFFSACEKQPEDYEVSATNPDMLESVSNADNEDVEDVLEEPDETDETDETGNTEAMNETETDTEAEPDATETVAIETSKETSEVPSSEQLPSDSGAPSSEELPMSGADYEAAWEASFYGLQAVMDKDVEGYRKYIDITLYYDFITKVQGEDETLEDIVKSTEVEGKELKLKTLLHVPEDVSVLNQLSVSALEAYQDIDVTSLIITDAYKIVPTDATANNIESDIYTVKINGKWYLGLFTSSFKALSDMWQIEETGANFDDYTSGD